MFKIQKVLHLYKEEQKLKPAIYNNYIVSEKKDGIYTFVDYNGRGTCTSPISRQLRTVPSLLHTQEMFQELLPSTFKGRLIFETVIPGTDFHTANGILNRSVGNFAAINAEFHLHDLILYGKTNVPALDRYNILCDLLAPDVSERINILPILEISDDKAIWLEHAKQVWEKEGEGVVLKRACSPYHEGKRDATLMKIKLEEKTKLLCISAYYSIGTKGHKCLNAVVLTEEGVELSLRVGKDKDVAAYEQDNKYLVGKMLEVKYMCKLPGGSLREPRMSRIIGQV
jgi:ATP-dependent DNA ligase